MVTDVVLDEFLIALGVKADTRGLDETERGLEGVEDQAKKTDKTLSNFSGKLGGFIKSFASFAVAAAGAISGVMLGAWAYMDGMIDRVEELQNAEDASIRTTKEQVDQAKKYRENMEKMGKVIDNVKTRIALSFLPTMYEMSKQYGKLLDDNKELIENGIKKLLAIVTGAAQVLTNFVRFIGKVVEGTVGWKNAMLVIIGVLGIMKRAMIAAFITNPIVWVVAAIAGLLLLIDDFMTYLDGGESEFGEFWGSMLGWIKDNQEAIDLLKQIFMGFVNFVAGAVALIVGIFTGNTDLMSVAWGGMIESLIAIWKGFAAFFEPLSQKIYEIVNGVVDKIVNAFKSMVGFVSNALASLVLGIGSIFSSVFNAITEPFRKAFDWVSDKWSGLKGIFGGAVNVNAGMGSAVSNTSNKMISNNTTVNNNGSFNITGAKNPTAVASAVQTGWGSMTQSNMGGVVKA